MKQIIAAQLYIHHMLCPALTVKMQQLFLQVVSNAYLPVFLAEINQPNLLRQYDFHTITPLTRIVAVLSFIAKEVR